MDISKIPLYDYQEKISREIENNITSKNSRSLNFPLESRVIFPINFLKSPLGSGKTRMMVRSIYLLSGNSKRYNYSRDVFYDGKKVYCSQEKVENFKVFIVVPRSIIEQWQKELERWGFDYFCIDKPKLLKRFLSEDIKKNIFLVDDVRFKEIVKNNLYVLEKSHVFVDDFDTLTIRNWDIYRPHFSSMTICSANECGVKNNDLWEFDIIRCSVDQETVDKKIVLPEIIVSKFGFEMGIYLRKLCPYVNDSVRNLIEISDFGTLFRTCGIPMNRLDLLINFFIEDASEKLKNHQLLSPELQNYPFTVKMKLWVNELTKILDEGWGSGKKLNCVKCFGLFDGKHLDKNSVCESCSSGVSCQSRIGVLDQVLKTINIRTGRSKKVLIYCSSQSLVNELTNYLEEINLWSHRLSGSSSVRSRLINKYKNAEEDIYLVCNSIQDSAGIDIPETTDIIIYHEIEKKYDTQIVGRGQRLGRTDNLYIHRIERLL